MGDEHRAQRASFDAAERAMATTPASGFDPRPLLASLDVPGLWLFGAVDRSIPSARSVAVLAALRDRGRPFEWAIVPGAGHLLLRRRVSFAPLPGTPDVAAELLLQWLGRQSGAAKSGARVRVAGKSR